MTDHITLPRAVIKQMRVALEESSMRFFLLAAYCDASVNGVKPSIGHEKAKVALAALDAALAEPDATREPATVEQVIAAHGPSWGPSATADFFTGFRAAERFHEIGKEDK